LTGKVRLVKFRARFPFFYFCDISFDDAFSVGYTHSRGSPDILGVTQNVSAYQDLATSNSNIYAEYTEISYRNG
jgi:inosine-uridine nucleoside N-ribohydrolase